MTTPFQVVVERGRDRALVSVHGEVDISTAPELTTALEDADKGGEQVVVDLTPTTFIDSTGLRTIVHAARRIGERFVLVCPPHNSAVMRVVDLSGFQLTTEMAATLDEVPPRG